VAAGVRIQAVDDEHRARIAAVVSRHESTLLRVARQHSLCHDDALDAYQRALEIFVRHASTVDPATEVAWLKVVVRHEAMAIRRARSQLVAAEDVDLDALPGADLRSVEEQHAATERVRRSAEALRALKPDEAKALVLKAHGLSYDEIGKRYGWTYTKVNRSITEGRRRFIDTYEGIDSGERCDQFADTLEALAAGRATPREILAIRPHLRHCAGCRSTVRALHLSRLRRALLLVPLVTWRARVYELVHRSGASEMALNVQAASTRGGGRLATAAAVLGVCVSGAGAGTVCVVSGLLDEPPRKPTHAAAARQATRASASSTPAPSRRARPSMTAAATPTATARPAARRPSTTSRSKPRANRAARNAKAVAEHEFGFERSAPTAPASSPAVATASSAGTPSHTSPAPSAEPAPAAADPAAAEFAP
jgi:RNA polymerase sigma factor (sigma-70 family)